MTGGMPAIVWIGRGGDSAAGTGKGKSTCAASRNAAIAKIWTRRCRMNLTSNETIINGRALAARPLARC